MTKKTILVAHVHYTKTAQSFIKDLYEFINDEDMEVVQNNYDNIKKSVHDYKFEIDDAAGDEIIYYLLWLINSERFCDGLLLSNFEDGTIMKCLKKLKSIDDKNISNIQPKDTQNSVKRQINDSCTIKMS